MKFKKGDRFKMKSTGQIGRIVKTDLVQVLRGYKIYGAQFSDVRYPLYGDTNCDPVLANEIEKLPSKKKRTTKKVVERKSSRKIIVGTEVVWHGFRCTVMGWKDIRTEGSSEPTRVYDLKASALKDGYVQATKGEFKFFKKKRSKLTGTMIDLRANNGQEKVYDRPLRSSIVNGYSAFSKLLALRALKVLCEYFHIESSKVILKWTKKIKNGKTNIKRFSKTPIGARVIVGPNCWRGPELVFLHEFAHVLAGLKRGEVQHGMKFWTALEEVTQAWYGDALSYRWSNEYARGKAYGKKLEESRKETKVVKQSAKKRGHKGGESTMAKSKKSTAKRSSKKSSSKATKKNAKKANDSPFWNYLRKGMPIKDMAEKLGQSYGTVYSRVLAAKNSSIHTVKKIGEGTFQLIK